ncbi:MAG: hypothetical protein EVJ46_00915 [Candidatus Acididesulfobacter guangdongensis]|uniref:Uncharacterized protein n=1 Tax=Acididesulfobacter guangdongensis TaxID=2597225 RepID=A0A519BHV2_ACIG2|nr:MAG: hypothetical protein EVJ46_00915 [Candidatus Acididesulfobacter guangdongensis]
MKNKNYIKKIILAAAIFIIILTVSACSKKLSGKKSGSALKKQIQTKKYNFLVSTKRSIKGKIIAKDYGTYCRTFKYSGTFQYLQINKKINEIIKPEAEKVGANAYLNMIMTSSYHAERSSKHPAYSVHVCGELVKLNISKRKKIK